MTVRGIVAAGIGFGGRREMAVRGLIAGLATGGGGGGGGYVPYPVYPDDWEEKKPGVWTRRKKKRKPKPTDEELLRMVAMLD